MRRFPEVGLSVDKRHTLKGKHSYITAITYREPRKNLPSKGTFKIKITQMMDFYKNDISSSPKASDRPMLGFWDSEKVRDIDVQ